jgi:hypothetical protein
VRGRYVGWYRHIALAMLAHAFLAAWPCKSTKKGSAEADTPDLVYLTPAKIRRLLDQLNPAAILNAATTR